MLHKPKGGAKGLKFGKWYALKRKQGEKCYFSPCAFISKSYHQPLFLLFVVGADKEQYIRQQRRPEKD